MEKIIGIIKGIIYHACNMFSLYTAVALFSVAACLGFFDSAQEAQE